jgi:hypothetical protein
MSLAHCCATAVADETCLLQGEVTKDPVYVDAERRFQDLEIETKKLHEESKK